jgi:GcrA cell cycle regulator
MQHDQRVMEKHPWTAERVEMLKQMWNEGLSASTIAGRLGPGVTRNAVIGKVHRLGLSGRPTPARTASPRPRAPRQPTHPGRRCLMPTHGATALKPHAITLRALRPLPDLEPEPEPIRILDIPKGERVNLLMLNEKTCRWPIGDPGTEDFFFCGMQPKTGRPYCEYHARIAYQTIYERRRTKRA